MKMYVWADPWSIRYGSSVVIAVAESEDDARAQVAEGRTYAFARYDNDGCPHLDKLKLGKPDRVLDLPCAEAYWWSE